MTFKEEMANKTKLNLVITISGKVPIHQVASDLRAAGLQVDQVLDAVGSVTGSAHSDTVARLRSVPGVANVSPDHPVDIGPPGAAIS